jgi:hypothetical protein
MNHEGETIKNDPEADDGNMVESWMARMRARTIQFSHIKELNQHTFSL